MATVLVAAAWPLKKPAPKELPPEALASKPTAASRSRRRRSGSQRGEPSRRGRDDSQGGAAFCVALAPAPTAVQAIPAAKIQIRAPSRNSASHWRPRPAQRRNCQRPTSLCRWPRPPPRPLALAGAGGELGAKPAIAMEATPVAPDRAKAAWLSRLREGLPPSPRRSNPSATSKCCTPSPYRRSPTAAANDRWRCRGRPALSDRGIAIANRDRRQWRRSSRPCCPRLCCSRRCRLRPCH